MLGALYFASIFAEFVTPYPALHRFKEYGEAPPTRIHFVSPTRGLSRPFVLATARELDKATFKYRYIPQRDREHVIRFFVRAEEPLTLLGFIPWQVKLFGVEDPSVPLFLFGSDRLGRDVFSRIFYAGRISLFIGFGAIIRRHLIPGVTSYLITHLTLAIPGMIIGETALSFLGLGIRPPAVSWGTLLQDAQSISLGLQPWLMIPGAFVLLAVLMFNFIGDGLRDAADPYAA